MSILINQLAIKMYKDFKIYQCVDKDELLEMAKNELCQISYWLTLDVNDLEYNYNLNSKSKGIVIFNEIRKIFNKYISYKDMHRLWIIYYLY